jgi:hypothetical protein
LKLLKTSAKDVPEDAVARSGLTPLALSHSEALAVCA